MSDPQANKELVMRFVEAGNGPDLDAFDELLAPDFKRHCPATPGLEVNSPADFKRFIERSFDEMPDAHVRVKHIVAEGDMVALWSNFSGTQEGPMGPFPASGNFCSTDFGGVFRIADGRIAELWVTWDNLDMLVQLGHIEPPPQPPDA